MLKIKCIAHVIFTSFKKAANKSTEDSIIFF